MTTKSSILSQVIEEMEHDKDNYIHDAVWYQKAKVQRYIEKAIDLALQESKREATEADIEELSRQIKQTAWLKTQIEMKDSQIAALEKALKDTRSGLLIEIKELEAKLSKPKENDLR